jgi:hypothetical protein
MLLLDNHVLALPRMCAFAHLTLDSFVIPVSWKMLSHSSIQASALSPKNSGKSTLGVRMYGSARVCCFSVGCLSCCWIGWTCIGCGDGLCGI